MTPRPTHALAATLLAIAFCLTSRALAAEFPAEQRVKILLRALAYDRDIASRADGKKLVIKVLFDPAKSSSTDDRDTVVSALKGLSKDMQVKGFKLSVAAVAFTNAAALEDGLAGGKIAAVYVCAGLKDAVGEITAVTRKARVASLSGSKAFAEAGVAISVVADGDRGQIIVNLPAAEAEGMKLDAGLLKLSKVLR